MGKYPFITDEWTGTSQGDRDPKRGVWTLKHENDLKEHRGILSSFAGLERIRERKRLDKQSPDYAGFRGPAKDFEFYSVRNKNTWGYGRMTLW